MNYTIEKNGNRSNRLTQVARNFVLFLMSAVLFLGGAIPVRANSSLEDAMNKVNLYTKGSRGQQLLTFQDRIDAGNFAATMVMYTDERTGQELSAYCCNPDRGGVEENGSYSVDIDLADDNPQLWGVITNGYPNKTPAEMGVSTEYEAYYVTKMAVWAVAYAPYSNLDDWKANGDHNAHIETAMKNLVAIGRATTSIEQTWATFSPVNPTPVRVDDTIVQEFDIESNVEISSFGVSFSGDVPSGIVVTDSATGSTGADGNVFGSATSRIKVTIPFSDGDDDLKFDMELKLVMENKAVLYGVSHNSALQNYYVSPIPLVLDYIPLTIEYDTVNSFCYAKLLRSRRLLRR